MTIQRWQLGPIICKNIVHTFNFIPELGLFASYLNAQVPCYVSWFPDPNAVANDAFSLSWENKKFYAFLPFSLIGATLAKIRKEQSTGIMIVPWWGTQVWFPLILQTLIDFPIQLPQTEYINFTKKGKVHPQEIEEVIADSWRTSTRSRYVSMLKRWKYYALSRNEYPYIIKIDSVLKFLHGMYNDSCLYSGLFAARSASASVVTIKGFVKLLDHPLLVRYLKGIFNRHPSLPRYIHIWNINLVLTYYSRIGHNEDLEFKYLIKKIVRLFMITGARRKHALSTIYVDNIVFKNDKVILLPNKI